MKILIDARVVAKGTTSGIPLYARLLIDHLLRHAPEDGFEFFWGGARKGPFPAEWRGERRRVIDWRVPNRFLNFTMRFLGQPTARWFSRADLLFSPHFTLLRAGRMPRVITFHDLSFLHHPRFFTPGRRLWHALQDWEGEARRASRLIAVSEFTRLDLIAALHLPAEKVVAVHSGVDPFYRPLPPRDPAIAEFSLRRGVVRPFLLAVGVLEPRKNLEGVIRAFTALKAEPRYRDFELIIAGPPGWLYHRILKEIDASPARGDIRLWGPAFKEDLRMLYHLAEALLYPSFFEGFGFPVLEAQACGCPVVASNTTSLPEVAGKGAAFVDPAEPDAIAAAVKEICEKPSFRDRLRREGRENVKRFSWDTAAKQTLRVFREAVV